METYLRLDEPSTDNSMLANENPPQFTSTGDSIPPASSSFGFGDFPPSSAIPIALPSPVVASVALSRKRRRGMCLNIADGANDPTNSLLSRLTFNSIAPPPNLIHILSAHPLLRSHPPPVLAALAQECTCISVPAGTTIVSAGSPMDMFYVVVKGEVLAVPPTNTQIPLSSAGLLHHTIKTHANKQALNATSPTASPPSLTAHHAPPPALPSALHALHGHTHSLYDSNDSRSGAESSSSPAPTASTSAFSFPSPHAAADTPGVGHAVGVPVNALSSTLSQTYTQLSSEVTRIGVGASFGDVCLVHPTQATCSYLAAPAADTRVDAVDADTRGTGAASNGGAGHGQVLLAQIKGASCRFIMASHARTQHSALSLFLNQLPCFRDLHGLPHASHGVITVVPQPPQTRADSATCGESANAASAGRVMGYMGGVAGTGSPRGSPRALAQLQPLVPARAPHTTGLTAAPLSAVAATCVSVPGARALSPPASVQCAVSGEVARQGLHMMYMSPLPPLPRSVHPMSAPLAGNGKHIFSHGLESGNRPAGNVVVSGAHVLLDRDSPTDTLTPGLLTPSASEYLPHHGHGIFPPSAHASGSLADAVVGAGAGPSVGGGASSTAGVGVGVGVLGLSSGGVSGLGAGRVGRHPSRPQSHGSFPHAPASAGTGTGSCAIVGGGMGMGGSPFASPFAAASKAPVPTRARDSPDAPPTHTPSPRALAPHALSTMASSTNSSGDHARLTACVSTHAPGAAALPPATGALTQHAAGTSVSSTRAVLGDAVMTTHNHARMRASPSIVADPLAHAGGAATGSHTCDRLRDAAESFSGRDRAMSGCADGADSASASDDDGDGDDEDHLGPRRSRAKPASAGYSSSESDDSDGDEASEATYARRPLRAPTSTPCSSDMVCLQQPAVHATHLASMDALARHVDRLAEGAVVLYLHCKDRAQALRDERAAANSVSASANAGDAQGDGVDGAMTMNSPTVDTAQSLAPSSVLVSLCTSRSHVFLHSGDRIVPTAATAAPSPLSLALPAPAALDTVAAPVSRTAPTSISACARDTAIDGVVVSRGGRTVAISMVGTEAMSPTNTLRTPACTSPAPARCLLLLSGRLALHKPRHRPLVLSCGDMALIDTETTVSAASQSWFGICQPVCGVDVPDISAVAVVLPEDLGVAAVGNMATLAGFHVAPCLPAFTNAAAHCLGAVSPVAGDAPAGAAGGMGDDQSGDTANGTGTDAGADGTGGVGVEEEDSMRDSGAVPIDSAPTDDVDAAAVQASEAFDVEARERAVGGARLGVWLQRYVKPWVREDAMM